MTFPLEWLFVAALCLYSLWLARRLERALQELSDTQAELQIERRMRQKNQEDNPWSLYYVDADMRFYEGGHND